MTQVPGAAWCRAAVPVVPESAPTPDSPAAAHTAPAADHGESRPIQPVGWYRTMETAWATEHFGFPADPNEGDEWTADDGSVWVFSLTGTPWWEMSAYPPAPFRLKLEALFAKHTWPAEAVDELLADTELLDALVAYRQREPKPEVVAEYLANQIAGDFNRPTVRGPADGLFVEGEVDLVEVVKALMRRFDITERPTDE